MEQLEIKITGSGTQSELIEALKGVIASIEESKESTLMLGVEWEDATLMTVITA